MCRKIIVFISCFTCAFICHAQVTVFFKGKSYNTDTRLLRLEVKPTFGPDSIALKAIVGEESSNKQPDTTDFYIEYENIPTEKKIVSLPTGVNIENLSKTFYPIPTPVYSPDDIDRNSTKGWEIVFSNVPEYAGCIKVNIAGTLLELGDLADAPKAREVRLQNFLEDRKKKKYSLLEVDKAKNDSLLKEIRNQLNQYVAQNPTANYKGKMTWLVDTLGVNTFSLVDDTNQVEPLETLLKNSFSNKTLPIISKLGYPVTVVAEYSILVQSGTHQVNASKGKPKYVPSLYNEEIQAFIKKKLEEKRRYKVQYQYASINGQVLPSSSLTIKKVFLNREQQNIFIFGTFIAVGIILALAMGAPY
ncbi:MAG: hypothetical protein K2Q22_12335 [Cytophagales bacterium]|nr:hypothetical protein [Cytophagales bacterium]